MKKNKRIRLNLLERQKKGLAIAAGAVSNLNISQAGGIFTLTFDYSGANAIPPRATGFDEGGKPTMTFQTPDTPTAGETVTFNMPNYYSPSGRPAGTHIYELYVGNPSTGSFNKIYDSSLNGGVNQYTLTTDDGGKLLLKAWAVDADGNQSLEPAYSEFSADVVGAFSESQLMDHIYDSESSYLKADDSVAANGEEVDKWVDRIGSGVDLHWNGEAGATRATKRADNEGLVLTETSGDQAYRAPDSDFSPIPEPNHVFLVLKNTGSATYGFIWKGSAWNVRLNDAGDLIISDGTTVAGVVPNDGNFYIVEFEAAPTTGKVIVNGTEQATNVNFAFGVRSVNLGDNSSGNQSRPAHYGGIYLRKDSLLAADEASYMRDKIAARYGITL